MSRRIALALFGMLCAASIARAQVPYSNTMLPTRTQLERVGLEKNWFAVVPMESTEKILHLSHAEDLLFIQTDKAKFHAFEANTGRYLWGTTLGFATPYARGASVNSDRVFVTSGRQLFSLDRKTGRKVFEVTLDDFAASPTAADEELVIVGLRNGKVSAFSVRDHTKDKPPGRSAGSSIFNWQTGKTMSGRPIPADRVVAFGSQDGKAYVAQITPAKLVFRFLTSGPISASMGTLGARTLLIPSEDYNLYAVDLFDGTTKWTFPTGSPIDQEPLVSGQAIYMINQAGELFSVHPDDGTQIWSLQTERAKLLAIGARRIYLVSTDRDLLIADRESGRWQADGRSTHDLAGLDLRQYEISLTNRLDDRLVFATRSGLILCLREPGAIQPTLLRDKSKEQPFGVLLKEPGSTQPPAGGAEAEPPAGEMPEEPAPANP